MPDRRENVVSVFTTVKPPLPIMEVHAHSNFALNRHTITIQLTNVPEEELQAILDVIARVKNIVKNNGGAYTGG